MILLSNIIIIFIIHSFHVTGLSLYPLDIFWKNKDRIANMKLNVI